MTNLPVIFKKAQINGLTLPCRIFRSSTFEAFAGTDGTATPRLTKYYQNLVKGKVGMITSSGVYTEIQGRHHLKVMGLVNQKQIDSIAKMIDSIHKVNGKIVLQLNHGGLEAKPKFTGGLVPAGPSASSKHNRALTKDEVYRIINSFINAAKVASEINADGIELHAAHGYLLGQFLSPIWNKRTDDFGGTVEKRARMLRLIIHGIKTVVPPSFPVLAKINGSDIEEGGVTLEMAIQTAKIAEKAGVDALEISCGSGRKPYSLMGDCDFENIFPDPKKREIMKKRFSDIHFTPHFNEEFATEIKKHVKVPIICVGGYRTLQEMNDAIESGRVDFVSLSRPLIREPHLVADMMSGKCKESTCVSCNRCFFETSPLEKPLKCYYPY